MQSSTPTAAHNPLTTAEALWRDRRCRDAVFGEHRDGFGEPAWDMLLSLFIEGERDRGPVPARELVDAVGAPEVIARPFLLWLATQGLVSLTDDAATLRPRGRDLMLTFLDQRGGIERV